MRVRRRLVIVASVALAACGAAASPTPACPFLGGPGLTTAPAVVLHVRDAQTGLPAASGSTVTATYRAFGTTQPITKVGRASRDSLIMAVEGREGIYDVLWQKPGYVNWSSQGVVVHSRCAGPETVTIDATVSKVAPQ